MRITRQTLYKIALDTVERKKRTAWNLLSVYLHGSVWEGNPVLGGTADIDLVFVHNDKPETPHEIEELTAEVHLDILHHGREEYREGRKLRLHPRLGPLIYGCKILYDPQHFLDFLQAGVRGLFHRPDNVVGRAQQLLDRARQTWMNFYRTEPESSPTTVAEYLDAVECAANAVASLNGPPLPERRLLLLFPPRVDAVGRSGLYLGLLGLLGANAVEVEEVRAWLPAWEESYTAVATLAEHPTALHPQRRLYYLRAIEALLESEQPMNALWPLLHTWTQAIQLLPEGAAHLADWQAACLKLEIGGTAFRERIAALDAYLDTVEETLEEWGRAHGA